MEGVIDAGFNPVEVEHGDACFDEAHGQGIGRSLRGLGSGNPWLDDEEGADRCRAAFSNSTAEVE